MEALPEDLIEEILLRLPVKSLIRFKTVSKEWYSLLSKDNNFAKLKLKHPSSTSRNLILYEVCSDGGTIFQSFNVDTSESRKIVFPVEISTYCPVIGSANGLICVVPSDKQSLCYIWNPCTLECKRIYVAAAYFHVFGFGYDSVSDDYKVLEGGGSIIQIFSFKTNSWKRKIGYNFRSPRFTCAFYLNGALHWCSPQQIISFDLAKEEPSFLDLPGEFGVHNIYHDRSAPLFDYKGSLCIYSHMCIWMMKEYTNSKSWVKLSTTLPYIDAKPLCVSRLGELVFLTRGGFGLLKSDIKGRIPDDNKAHTISFKDAFLYTESLISFKCFDKKKLIN